MTKTTLATLMIMGCLAVPAPAASFQGLGDLPGGYTNSTAYGISPDGSVVIGRAYPGAFINSTHEAYAWTAQSGFVHLGFAPGDEDSVAWAASAHGEKIVGDNLSRAIIWDSRHGMRRLREALVPLTEDGLGVRRHHALVTIYTHNQQDKTA